MKIETIYEFVFLAYSLNFTETSKRFFISQSTLSAHVSSLEAELGIELFVRDSHSVRLTKAGLNFLDDAQCILGDYERALTNISRFKDDVQHVLRIGFLLGTYGSFLPSICRKYHECDPAVEFSFKVLDVSDMQSSLAVGDIDVAFTVFSDDLHDSRFDSCTFFRDRYKLAVPKTHRLAKASRLSVDDLRGETVLAPCFNPTRSTLSRVSTQLRNANVKVLNDCGITDAASLIATLVARNGIAIALDHLSVYSGDSLVFIPLEGERMEIRVGAIWKKAEEGDPVTSFIDFFRRSTQGLKKQDFLSRKAVL